MRRTQVPLQELVRAGARLAGLGLLLVAAGCAKFETLPPAPVAPIKTRVLMHRGAGNDPAYHQNTLEAVRHGSTILDGAEFDLQLSADGTLWLGHDNEIKDCIGNVVANSCFQDLTNAEIEAYAACPDGRHYDTLETVLAAVSVEFPAKFYSFDVKGQYCALLGIPDLMAQMAGETDRLVRLYRMGGKVETETDTREYLAMIRDLGTPVASLVVSLGEIDGPLATAAEFGAAGISFKYDPNPVPPNELLTRAVVDGIHGVGYRIAVWTIDTPEDIAAVWATGPDVIQTDNPDFYGYVPK
jgi:glycerophosphoryl diester phosphodiesterase